MTTYQCTKCGKISPDESQICDTKESISSFYICENCNKHNATDKSLCKPVQVSPAYYCGSCGTSAQDKKSLCEPVKL
jgi:DNA-directed RNA polymerase subunit RPC12/RpoP